MPKTWSRTPIHLAITIALALLKGGWNEYPGQNEQYDPTSDLLNLDSMTWRAGPDLPYNYEASRADYVEYNGSLMLIGGKSIAY